MAKENINSKKAKTIQTKIYGISCDFPQSNIKKNHLWQWLILLLLFLGATSAAIAIPLSTKNYTEFKSPIPSALYRLNSNPEEFTSDITKGEGYVAPIEGHSGEQYSIIRPSSDTDTMMVDGNTITANSSMWVFNQDEFTIDDKVIYETTTPNHFTTNYKMADGYTPENLGVRPTINGAVINSLPGGTKFDPKYFSYEEVQAPQPQTISAPAVSSSLQGIPSDWDVYIDDVIAQKDAAGNVQFPASTAAAAQAATWSYNRDQKGIAEIDKYPSYIDLENKYIVNFHRYNPFSIALMVRTDYHNWINDAYPYEPNSRIRIPGIRANYNPDNFISPRTVWEAFLKSASRIEIIADPSHPNSEWGGAKVEFSMPGYSRPIYLKHNNEPIFADGAYFNNGDFSFNNVTVQKDANGTLVFDSVDEIKAYIDWMISRDGNNNLEFLHLCEAIYRQNTFRKPSFRYYYKSQIDGHNVEISHVFSGSQLKSGNSRHFLTSTAPNIQNNWTGTSTKHVDGGGAHRTNYPASQIPDSLWEPYLGYFDRSNIYTGIPSSNINVTYNAGTPASQDQVAIDGEYKILYAGIDTGLKLKSKSGLNNVLPAPTDGMSVPTSRGYSILDSNNQRTNLVYDQGAAITPEVIPLPVNPVAGPNPIWINNIEIRTERGLNWDWGSVTPPRRLFVRAGTKPEDKDFVTDETLAEGYVAFVPGTLPDLCTETFLMDYASMHNNQIIVDGKTFTLS